MKILAFLIFALLLAAAAFVVFPQARETLGIRPVPVLSDRNFSDYEALTLFYQDPELDFKVRYPAGYVVTAEDGQSVSFYTPTLQSLSEAHTFFVVNETRTIEDLKRSVQNDVEGARVTLETTLSLNGKTAPLIYYQADSGPVRLHLVQSLLSCTGYQLYYLGVVPDVVSEDVILSEYMLKTAQC